MSVPPIIPELVERFTAHREAYTRGGYNETQLRREFLDPFFVALGWDVYNEQGYAEAYKDVVHEDAIKVGGTTKAPDYSFRIGGRRKFFVEAKKPSVDIRHDVHPAYQVRRYAWNAKLPLSIVSDFEEFAVYDCRTRPKTTDKASTARLMYFTYAEYTTRWDEIAGTFSKDAILKGAFDKYAQKKRRKRGTAEVDDEFLADMERWRIDLAKHVVRHNTLTARQLNHAVQLILDRIIFLRICEDRGIEPAGALQSLLNGPRVYDRLFEKFRHADQRYNSGLFHFDVERGRGEPDRLTPGLTVGDRPLKDIISHLYPPDSPYEFSVMPADILGQVYERFLGNVISLSATGKTAKVEAKPEVRKAGGVYYTPTYIVEYIVEHTVGALLKGEEDSGTGVSPLKEPSSGTGVSPLKEPSSGTGVSPVKESSSGTGVSPVKESSSGTGVSPVKESSSGPGVSPVKEPPSPTLSIKGRELIYTKTRPPRMNKPLRVLDPACGSGSFLLGAYEYLLNWHLKWYVEHDPEKWARTKHPPIVQRTSALGGTDSDQPESSVRRAHSTDDSADAPPGASAPLSVPPADYKLTTPEKKRILLAHIYGVDIDAQAVEVTKLSLLLKVLEGENEETIRQQFRLFHERALPDLSSNIKCGNSLIGPDFYEAKQMSMFDDEDIYRINAFDWHTEFPEVFFPSPFGRGVRGEGSSSPSPSGRGQVSEGDSPRRGEGSSPGFDAVIGNPPYVNVQNVARTDREFLVATYGENGSLGKRWDLYQVFLMRGMSLLESDGRLGMILPNTFLMGRSYELLRHRIFVLMQILEIVDLPQGVFAGVTVDNVLLFLRREDDATKRKPHRVQVHKLEPRSDKVRVQASDWDEDFVLLQHDLMTAPRSRINVHISPTQSELFARLAVASTPLGNPTDSSQGIILYKTKAAAELAEHTTFEPREGWGRLLRGRGIGRYIVKWNGEFVHYGPWLWCQRDEKFFTRPKILLHALRNKSLSRRLVGTYDDEGYYNAHNLANIINSDESPYDLRYILGCFNSNLLNFWYKSHFPNVNINPNNFRQLPIRTIDFSNADDVAKHDRMVELVQSMLDMNAKLHGSTLTPDPSPRGGLCAVWRLLGCANEKTRPC